MKMSRGSGHSPPLREVEEVATPSLLGLAEEADIPPFHEEALRK